MHTARVSRQLYGRIIRRRSFLFIVPLALLLTFVLAACGSNGGTGAGGSTPTTAPTSTGITGTGTAEGCPSTEVPTTAQNKPDVTIASKDSNSTITAHTGNLIEVRLPFGKQWSGPTTSQGVLQLQPPAGYALQSDKVCVWHFTAQSTGTTELVFTAKAICTKGHLCPLYVLRSQFTISVK